jgi:hypothetical protein
MLLVGAWHHHSYDPSDPAATADAYLHHQAMTPLFGRGGATHCKKAAVAAAAAGCAAAASLKQTLQTRIR